MSYVVVIELRGKGTSPGVEEIEVEEEEGERGTAVLATSSLAYDSWVTAWVGAVPWRRGGGEGVVVVDGE